MSGPGERFARRLPRSAHDRALLLVLVLLALMLPAFLATGRLLGDIGIAKEIYAFAHVLWFAAAGFAAAPFFRGRRDAGGYGTLKLLVVLMAIGTGIEAIQPAFGRSAGLDDLVADLAGSLLGAARAAPGRQRWLLLLLGSGLTAVMLHTPAVTLVDRAIARLQFPQVASFETPLEESRWTRGERSAEQSVEGRYSLRLRLSGSGYRSTALRRAPRGWSSFGSLRLAVHASRPTTLRLSIGDRRHRLAGSPTGDRYDAGFGLARGWNRIEVPLEDIRTGPEGRELDLDRIERFVLFVRRPETPLTLYLDDLRLAP